jgi:hypothetical protein
VAGVGGFGAKRSARRGRSRQRIKAREKIRRMKTNGRKREVTGMSN